MMKMLKENAVERAHDASTRLSGMQGENVELHINVTDLQELLANYNKLDMITELIKEDHLVQSITEINATIQRYGAYILKSRLYCGFI